MDGLNIKDFAAQTGLSAHTLRYYEKIGLMPGVQRTDSGQRRYSEDDAAWVGLLRCLRATGMPLKTLQRFVELELQGEASAPERLALLRAHENDVQAQRAELEMQHRKLLEKLEYHERLVATQG